MPVTPKSWAVGVSPDRGTGRAAVTEVVRVSLDPGTGLVAALVVVVVGASPVGGTGRAAAATGLVKPPVS